MTVPGRFLCVTNRLPSYLVQPPPRAQLTNDWRLFDTLAHRLRLRYSQLDSSNNIVRFCPGAENERSEV